MSVLEEREYKENMDKLYETESSKKIVNAMRKISEGKNKDGWIIIEEISKESGLPNTHVALCLMYLTVDTDFSRIEKRPLTENKGQPKSKWSGEYRLDLKKFADTKTYITSD